MMKEVKKRNPYAQSLASKIFKKQVLLDKKKKEVDTPKHKKDHLEEND